MKLEEWQLTVQVENLVNFVSLAWHDCDLSSYLRYQDLSGYFSMLDGPSYENLVKYFWVRAGIYDKYAAKAEEDHMVLLNPDMKGKSRAEMGLKEFKRTEIRSNVMGIPVTSLRKWLEEPAEGVLKEPFNGIWTKRPVIGYRWWNSLSSKERKMENTVTWKKNIKFFRSCCKNVFYLKEEV